MPSREDTTRPLRLLAVVEAASVTGPAKNLIDFCRFAAAEHLPLEPHLVTFQRGDSNSVFTDTVKAAGIPLTVIAELSGFDRSVPAKLKSVVSTLRPDIVQTHAVKSHFLIAASGLWRARPWVAFHHGYTTTDLKMQAYNQLDRWSLRKPAHLVTVSLAFQRQLMGTGVNPARISIVQNAVNAEWVAGVKQADGSAFRRELGIGSEDPVIVAIGRMSLEKAHSDLIEAFHLLRRDRPDAKLLLVGDGPERVHLESIAGEGVRFLGQNADVSRYYAIANAMALPSLTEGSPNVLLESMACGVPSVVTNVGGIPEIVTHGESALIVPPRDPKSMASALNRILSDKTLAQDIARDALRLIAERHSVGARAQSLIRIYRSVIH